MGVPNATDWMIRAARDLGYYVTSGGQIDKSATSQKVQLPAGVDSIGTSQVIVAAQDDSATPIDCSALFTAAAANACWALLEIDGSGVGHCTVGTPALFVLNVSGPEMPQPTGGYVVHAALFCPKGATAFDAISVPYTTNTGNAKILDKRCLVVSGGTGRSSGVIAAFSLTGPAFLANPTVAASVLTTTNGGNQPFAAAPSFPGFALALGDQYHLRFGLFIRTVSASTARTQVTIGGQSMFDYTSPLLGAETSPNARRAIFDATFTIGATGAACNGMAGITFEIFDDSTANASQALSLYRVGRAANIVAPIGTFDNSIATPIDVLCNLGSGNASSAIGIREFVLSKT